LFNQPLVRWDLNYSRHSKMKGKSFKTGVYSYLLWHYK
jgi:hypothetical protein